MTSCVKTVKMILGKIFNEEFGRLYTHFLEAEYGDEGTVVISAVGDDKNWVIQFWSEFQANVFYGIWDRMPSTEDIVKFYELNLLEAIVSLKEDRVCSENEEFLVPEDVSKWDAFFAPYHHHLLHFPDFFQDEETNIGAYIRNQDERMINMIMPEGVSVHSLSTSPNGNPDLILLVPKDKMEETSKLFIPKDWTCNRITALRDVEIWEDAESKSYKIVPVE